MDDSNSDDKYNTGGRPRHAVDAYRPDGWVSSPEDDDGQADGVPGDAGRGGEGRAAGGWPAGRRTGIDGRTSTRRPDVDWRTVLDRRSWRSRRPAMVSRWSMG